MSRVDEALRRASGRAGIDSIEEADSRVVRVEEFPAEDRRTAAVAARKRHATLEPVLASAPVSAPVQTQLPPSVDGKIVIGSDMPGASVEEYRRLATTLHLMQAQKGLQALIVSSALPRDGKTLTSTNLALTLSESYKRRVLLIDADFRRPSVHDVFGLPNSAGLANALRAAGPLSLPLVQVTEHLTILPAGTADASPVAGLTSERMRQVVHEARARFDWVILDTPPVGLISDANLLASLADGVLLVIGAGTTPYPAVQRAVSEFGRERIIGVVLNRVTEDVARKTSYGEYYQSHGTGSDRS
jgi:capsular exopolysaccharide synthesis family protein